MLLYDSIDNANTLTLSPMEAGMKVTPVAQSLPYRSRTDADQLIADLIATDEQTDCTYIAHPIRPNSNYYVVIAYDDTGRYRGSIR
jgi:hypothetical protein